MTQDLFGHDGYFTDDLQTADADVFAIIRREYQRQNEGIELIASENIVSRAVMQTTGCVFTNKYAEGYVGRRYYGGCGIADEVEALAIERAKKIFGVKYVNVQPHSGSQANQGVFGGLLKPGDTIMGMTLDSGGHLTHGSKVNQSGKVYNAVQYGVRKQDALIDYDEVEALAKEHNPKLIIAGGSAYPRVVDFQRFRDIADAVGAYLMVDMAHFAGLVAGGVYPSPVGIAHVITTTTHKTMRGARGGMILTNDEDIFKKINSGIFPGGQGGPLMHVVAAKAVAFGELLQPSFKQYAGQVLSNARTLADVLMRGDVDIVSGGTDSHIVLVDLRPKGLTGNVVESALERAGITCNKNGVPFDPEKPTVTSGVRLGTGACTARGFRNAEFELVGDYILEVLDGLRDNGAEGNSAVEQAVKGKVKALCKKFPLYPDAF